MSDKTNKILPMRCYAYTLVAISENSAQFSVWTYGCGIIPKFLDTGLIDGLLTDINRTMFYKENTIVVNENIVSFPEELLLQLRYDLKDLPRQMHNFSKQTQG